MVKLKNPLMSLKASGSLSRAITFLRRRGVDLAEKKPEIIDAKTPAQLSWRHMYQKAVALWHLLSAAEKQEWESAARPRHMTGFAWFMSQCLRPNPGIYLPLQGGTMSGDIDMDGYKIEDLPDPAAAQNAATKAYVDALEARYQIGARVYHNVDQACANGIWTTLAFNSELFDTDTIHSTTVFNSRLTCKTTGKYVISANISYEASAVGQRVLRLRLNGVTSIAEVDIDALAAFDARLSVTTHYALVPTDYVQVIAWQNSGGALDVDATAQFSPHFMMQRIG